MAAGLKENDFEALGLYDLDSRMNKLVGAKVKYVFERLFKNSGVNSDDFEFMCFHNENPNAFFIEKSKSKANKHIIAVSDSLIQALSCEEELAAVIAHECGHFLWDQYLGGKNTIVQERWSDVNSVDLMINAGYNPRYILEMQKKVFGNFKYDSVTLDVHGSNFARAEDVKAAITNAGLKRGDFSAPIPKVNSDWAELQKQVKDIYAQDGYNTYIEKLMLSKFGTKDVSQINRVVFFQLILDEIKNYNIKATDKVRINNLIKILQTMHLSQNKTPEEIRLLQDIFLTMYDRMFSISYGNKFLLVAFLDKFGPFLEQYDNMQNFIDSAYDKEKAKMYAEKIEKLKWTRSFARYFNDLDSKPWPKLGGLGANNVGKKFPGVQLHSYGVDVIDRAIDTMSSYVDLQSSRNNVLTDDYCVIDGESYYLDKKEIVVLYGEDAKKKHEQDQEEIQKQKEAKNYEDNKNLINSWVERMNALADFATGKISPQQYYEFLGNHNMLGYLGIVPVVQSVNHFLSEAYKPEMIDVYKRYVGSRGFDYFVRGGTPPLQEQNVPVEPNLTINQIGDAINATLNFRRSPVFYYRLKMAHLQFAEYLQQNNLLTQEQARSVWYFLTSSGEYENANISQYTKQFTIYGTNLIAKTPYVFDIGLADNIVKQNFIYNEESTYLQNILQQFGIKGYIKTPDELYRVFNELYSHNANKDFLFVMWADFLRHGGHADINTVIKYLAGMSQEKNPLGNNIAPVVGDVLAKYITDEEFNSLALIDKISVYEFMQTFGVFSDKFANQNKYIRRIVDNIVNQTIADNKAVEYAEKILTRQAITRYGNDRNSDIEFAIEREKLIEFYADYIANQLGRDNDSDEYLGAVDVIVERLRKTTNGKREFSSNMASAIAERVSSKVVAQARAAEKLGAVTKGAISGDQVVEYDYYVRAAEAAFAAIAHDKESVLKMINFLSEKMTPKSLDDISKYFQIKVNKVNTDELPKHLSRSNLMMIHENFWGADLPLRAYMMNRLLNSYSNNDEDKLNLIIGMFFDEKSEYRKDADLVIHAVYNNLQDYERNLILAALASAGQRGDNQGLSGGQMVGRGLKMFLQNKGPAFIKFGQLLSYLPQLDSDIRQELAMLRDKAKMPTRSELFDILHATLPQSELDRISHVGKILGCGSFYITVHVVYNGKDCVVSVMRPFAHELTQSGMDMIGRTIDDLIKADKKYAPLKNILNQARESAFSEIDIEQDYKKYQNAKHMYEQLSVTMGDVTYSPDVAQWLTYGAGENGDNAFKIMEMSPGHSLAYDKWTEQQKHDFAVAYVTLELALLLSGQKWDTDRHQGQQNFYNADFRNFCIGIFDTGAQMNTEPGKVDKMMLGHLLYELASGVQQGKDIGAVLVKLIKNIDNTAQRVNVDTRYIDGVQRGLTALSDIMEYQKEQKDESGNVIQESRSLTQDDWANIIGAIYQSGIIDKIVEKTVLTKGILDRLMLWRTGLRIKNPNTGNEAGPETPIVLNYSGEEVGVNEAAKVFKSAQERLEYMTQKRQQPPIGMSGAVKPTDVDFSFV